MLSTCPSCLAQINHEDHLFEIQCDTCGARFNPFLGLEQTPPPTAPEPTVPGRFGESLATFQEVRDFGESLGLEGAPSARPTPKQTPAPVPPSAAAVERTQSDIQANLVTSGDTLQGYQIESYYSPVSRIGALPSDPVDPLKELIKALFAQATAKGANGLIGFHWNPISDGRVLLSAIPVRAQKLS